MGKKLDEASITGGSSGVAPGLGGGYHGGINVNSGRPTLGINPRVLEWSTSVSILKPPILGLRGDTRIGSLAMLEIGTTEGKRRHRSSSNSSQRIVVHGDWFPLGIKLFNEELIEN